MLSPSDLARLFDGRLDGSDHVDQPLAGLATDSREVVPGGGFVALRGESDDGHRFVAGAGAAGAVLAVVDEGWAPGAGHTAVPPLLLRVPDTAAALRRACERRLAELGCHVVGVTGSAGKTTAKELIATVLTGAVRVARTPGNLNTWTGIPLSVLALQPPLEAFVCEMAMSARGEIADLATFTHPRTGVLLNVGVSHIERLGSQEAIALAKAELLEALPLDGLAVCNGDDEHVRRVASRSPARIVWFGVAAKDAQFRATDIEARGIDGTRFTLVGPDGSARAELRVPGTHVVVDALAAAAVAAQFGIGVDAVAERLAEFEAPPQRGRVHVGLNGARIYDDSYNSSPASLSAALDTLGSTQAKRRVAVLGDMLELGDLAAMSHRMAGRHAAQVATTLIAVGEQGYTTVAAALAAGMQPEEAFAARSVDEAIEIARSRCGPDTAVLVKASHGMALERVVEALLR
ncbi:MAG TPA: UDP-N-acetylmuramoyl-tripeptide--D-alanyl-D-alanine ligase [Candidatus Dormibacteraeota bacterium]|nr:UDP-N-acetylmuramoyl-tripeptide--D-alanyl-D-alanine ligase [Candidatus Dormibacteraeota bacterium]